MFRRFAYIIEKKFDNRMFNESKAGEDFVGTNIFSIIARK